MTEITARLLLFMITAAQSGGGGGRSVLKRTGDGVGVAHQRTGVIPLSNSPKYNLCIWFAQVNLFKPLNSECSVSESDL